MKVLRPMLTVGFALASALALAQPDLEALERRLQEVEDILAIQRVLVDYAVHLDARDFDAYLELFAEDGAWQIGDTVRRGRAEIRAMLEGMYDEVEIEPFGYERFRLVANMEVDVDGDRAVARSRHLSVMRGERGNPQPVLSGLYEDELIRENGEWKILRRVDYPIMPTAEEWSRQLEEMQTGARE